MKVLLNNIEVTKETLLVNSGMNYGRFYNHYTEDYEIQLSTSEFIHLIESEYNNIRNEIKIDDQRHEDDSDFKSTNYCTLSELLVYKSEFEAIVKTYLDQILFDKLFSNSASNTFVINSTESVSVIENKVVISGKAYRLEPK
ncbi:hypothetical protein [Winogradskyella thalassocola]|nr:hypothetical protein [Winogradskyella thalassocola]